MLLEAHEKNITFKISKSAKLSIEVTSCYQDPTDVTPTQQGQNNHSPDVESNRFTEAGSECNWSLVLCLTIVVKHFQFFLTTKGVPSQSV